MPTPSYAPEREWPAPTAPLQYAVATPADHLLALYTQHADSARALASRLLYDRGEAEDVVQDVFLTLLRQPGCFDPDRGTGRAWLLTVVRNRSMDHLRRRCLKRSVNLKTDESVAEAFERIPDPLARDIVDDLEAATRSAALWRLVDALPPSQAALIRRAYADGQTHQEIASELALPLGTVKSRIRLGLEKLRYAIGSGQAVLAHAEAG